MTLDEQVRAQSHLDTLIHWNDWSITCLICCFDQQQCMGVRSLWYIDTKPLWESCLAFCWWVHKFCHVPEHDLGNLPCPLQCHLPFGCDQMQDCSKSAAQCLSVRPRLQGVLNLLQIGTQRIQGWTTITTYIQSMAIKTCWLSGIHGVGSLWSIPIYIEIDGQGRQMRKVQQPTIWLQLEGPGIQPNEPAKLHRLFGRSTTWFEHGIL